MGSALMGSATAVQALGPSWLDPVQILTGLGPWALLGICLIIFAECGLLVGFFLPGDSLLFITGFFAATGQVIAVPLWVVCAVLTVSAWIGNVVGYSIGRGIGPAIFDRPDGRLFKHDHVVRTQRFFDTYGNRAIVLARFVPVVRTFITVLAGVGQMSVRRYLTYSAIGALAWATGVTLLGALLGQIPFVAANIQAMILVVVALSLIPLIVEVIKARRAGPRADPPRADAGPAGAGPADPPPVQPPR